MGTILHCIATGFYTGYLPRAPGTWATVLVGLPLALVLHGLGGPALPVGWAAVLLLSAWSSARVAGRLREEDPSIVVIDEVAGLLTATIFLPWSATNVALACAFFRVFDIVKPFPIRTIERSVPGGWGITLDDILAGLYANLLVRVVGLCL